MSEIVWMYYIEQSMDDLKEHRNHVLKNNT